MSSIQSLVPQRSNVPFLGLNVEHILLLEPVSSFESLGHRGEGMRTQVNGQSIFLVLDSEVQRPSFAVILNE